MTYQNPTYCQNLSVPFSHNTFFGETPKNENSRKLRLDYYLFGSPMQGRSFNSNSYKFGFNGMESEDDLYGEKNAYDFGARIYDSRIGKFMSLDPDAANYPFMSPYCFAANNPIRLIDKNGEGPGDAILQKFVVRLFEQAPISEAHLRIQNIKGT